MAEQTFEPVDLSPDISGGIMKTIIKPGSGEAHPRYGDTVKVHYVGTLQSTGQIFDSSRDRGELFSFALGRGHVIKAWDVGVESMAQGEVARFVCSPQFAYGEGGQPPKIPPNATLIFDIELFLWQGEDISPDRDETILRTVIHEGKGYDTPNEGATCDVDIIGYLNDHMFMDEQMQLVIGEATEQGLPEGVDKALKRLKKGERSRIHLSSKWAYGSAGKREWKIPADSSLDFDIHCKDYQKVKESWSMSTDEKLEEAERLKDRGTHFFKSGKNKLAVTKYNKAIELLEHEKTLDGEQKERRDKLFLAASSNLALVMLKNGENVECIKFCDKVLEIDGVNVKAIYRRAQAQMNMCGFDEAIDDFKQVILLEPTNTAAQLAIHKCKQALQAENQKQKQIFANMFDKFAKQDEAKKVKIDDVGESREQAADTAQTSENGVESKSE